MPPGLRLATENQVESDAEIGGIEGAQPSGTRMLVAVQFAIKWPGFGVSADAADLAVRSLGGMRAWPELNRVVYSDPDGLAIWYFAYLSSPAWWAVILIACAAIIAAAITLRIVWTVVPEEFHAPVVLIGQMVPLILLVLVGTIVVPMLTEGTSGRPP